MFNEHMWRCITLYQFICSIWMLIAEGPSWWTKEIFAPWKCWFHTLCKVPGLHGLHPTGAVASPILTFAPAVALEAAAERGLRLTYCSVNGHQVGAPVRIPLGIGRLPSSQTGSQWMTFLIVSGFNFRLDMASTSVYAACGSILQFFPGLVAMCSNYWYQVLNFQHDNEWIGMVTSCLPSNMRHGFRTTRWCRLLNFRHGPKKCGWRDRRKNLFINGSYKKGPWIPKIGCQHVAT